eukprot:CAMPEP_0117442512 /NCGR_PEP_ID=MMETSP0759-20121206/4191_1 /TAXON_ID=63605 /ORGANISM="Percolomonas cosmopolitus, Strain WS" /LENGTH=726 /DNA_ID=CAMNT_0005234405 /DNA_START=261 /DNA_END=2441 /DNA_ORIENTATION=+
MRVLTRQGTAQWNQSFDINKISLFRAKRGSKYKKKYIVFKVYETNREKSIGKCKVALDEICEMTQESYHVDLSVPCTLWKRNDAQLTLKFHIEPIAQSVKKHGNWIDDTVTDHTTMTDASEDPSDEEHQNTDALLSTPSTPSSAHSSSTPSLVTHHNRTTALDPTTSVTRARGGSVMLASKKPLKPSGLTITFDSLDSGAESNADKTPIPSPSPVDRQSARMRRLMRSSKERRNQSQSISMDSDERSFLDNIGDELLQVPSSFSRSSSVENLAGDPDSSTAPPMPAPPNGTELGSSLASPNTFATLSTPLSAVAPSPHPRKQQEELRFLYQKIALQEVEKKHRTLLDRIIRQVKREYPKGMNISAAILLRCLQAWDCFSSGSDNLLKEVVRTIEEVAEKSTDSDVLTYWLSACTAMLNVTQKEFCEIIEDTGNGSHSSVSSIVDLSVDSTKFQDIKTSLESTSLGSAQEDDFSFDNPVTQFQRDLRQISITIYSVIVQHVKKQLKSLLKDGMFKSEAISGFPAKHTVEDIVSTLEHVLKVFESNRLFSELITLFFEQIYYWMDAECFNILMDRDNMLVTANHGFSLKMNVSRLELWSKDSELFPHASERLCHLRQAADVLIMEKSNFVTESTRKDVCGDLNLAQVRQLLSNFRSDATEKSVVPSAVLRSIVVPPNSNMPLRLNQDKLFIPNLTNLDSIHSSLSYWQNVAPPQSLRDEEGFEFLREK